jgi:hypothetical protein
MKKGYLIVARCIATLFIEKIITADSLVFLPISFFTVFLYFLGCEVPQKPQKAAKISKKIRALFVDPTPLRSVGSTLKAEDHHFTSSYIFTGTYRDC